MPTIYTPNYMFRNDGDLQFSNVNDRVGLCSAVLFKRCRLCDLDNNGMLDIVVSNVNQPPFIYQNSAVQDSSSNFLKVKLTGSDTNKTGIGSKVLGYAGDRKFYVEQMPTRGFQSSVDPVLHLGLGEITSLDSSAGDLARWKISNDE